MRSLVRLVPERADGDNRSAEAVELGSGHHRELSSLHPGTELVERRSIAVDLTDPVITECPVVGPTLQFTVPEELRALGVVHLLAGCDASVQSYTVRLRRPVAPRIR